MSRRNLEYGTARTSRKLSAGVAEDHHYGRMKKIDDQRKEYLRTMLRDAVAETARQAAEHSR